MFTGTPTARAPAQAGAATSGAEKSIAVLPFADMSEKHDQEYFSDGLAEELIDVLTRVPNLRVPARTSSFSFKGKATTIGEIAHTLGVTHVLEGACESRATNAHHGAAGAGRHGFHLWSQTYDRNVRDIFRGAGRYRALPWASSSGSPCSRPMRRRRSSPSASRPTTCTCRHVT